MISILIPTFRRPDMLRTTVEGCFRQVHGNLKVEIVVVDNCPDASSRKIVAELANQNDAFPVRYVHEPRPGVSNARNTAIASSDGEYLVFLDDDEVPHDQWLQSLVGALSENADAAFGPVLPKFEVEPQAQVRGVARKCFSRDLGLSHGSDMTHLAAYVGTGNSVFRRHCVVGKSPVFDPRFGLTGGEDTIFIAQLVAEGRKFAWAADAKVDEFVPADRVVPSYLLTRRFYGGRNRSLSKLHPSMSGALRLTQWMLVGAAQVSIFGPFALVLYPFHKALSFECQARVWGGMGKLLWWRAPSLQRYGSSEKHSDLADKVDGI